MTDEEYQRLQEIVKNEIISRLLGSPIRHSKADAEWARDMHWLHRAQYLEILNKLREQYNFSPERQRELVERNEGEHNE